MDRVRPQKTLIFFAVVLLFSIITTVLLVKQCQSDNPSQQTSDTPQQNDKPNKDPLGNTLDDPEVEPTDTRSVATPEELVGRISEVAIRAHHTRDAQPLIELLGKKNLTPDQQEQLHKLAASSRLRLNAKLPFSPVAQARNRWALNLFDRSRIMLDLEKNDQGKWHVGKITLPGNKPDIADPNNPIKPDQHNPATATLQNFINAILKLNPTEARKHIDTKTVSYAKLAALCIIFEEGQYQLTPQQPFRQIFLRDTTAGWLVRVESKDRKQSAMFAINSKRPNANTPWKITEVNLDKLLANYAQRFSGGDIHYTPLVKNPQGGDSLVIYFDLDSENLTPRTQRQLGIVANLLKADENKNLTISGHTDALGSADYNLALSKKRAQKVVDFFAKNGVPTSQMKIIGFGKSQPRLPNQTGDGKDNPDGRRANRRAEILLNF